MARILLVHPGPDFSVADVYRGWEKALKKLGHTVMTYTTNDRLTFYGHARMPVYDREICEQCGQVPTRQAVASNEEIMRMAVDGIHRDLYLFWPDIVFFISAFYMTPTLLQTIRTRRHKIVMLHTESPYQDDEQMNRGEFADLNLLNDPANIEAWKDIEAPVHYMPHAYDPDVHYPKYSKDYESDFAFVGTLFPSRAKFFSQMDFTGLKVALGGAGWDAMRTDHPELVNKVMDRETGHRLIDYLGHPAEHSLSNDETARIYRGARAGINFYRRESEDSQSGKGWAMGPREIEMAACGLFFLRDPRPESDETFGGILPAFTGPENASEQLRWWLKHDRERETAAQQALEAVASRTFDANARKACAWMEEAGIL